MQMWVPYWRIAVFANVFILRWTFLLAAEFDGFDVPSSRVLVKYNATTFLDMEYTVSEYNLKKITNAAHWCPNGFGLVSTLNLTVCYKRKYEEHFSDYYKNCSKNIFTLELYDQLDIDKSEAVWSEYQTAYPGGPFINTQSAENLYKELDPKYNVTSKIQFNENLCIVIYPAKRYVGVNCNKKHYRYCVIAPVEANDCLNMTERCKDLGYPLSFSRPIPTCVTTIEYLPIYEHNSRLTEELCKMQNGSSSVNSEWIYSNYPLFQNSEHTMKSRLTSKIKERSVNQSDYEVSTVTHREEFVKNNYKIFNNICERTITPVMTGYPNIRSYNNTLKEYQFGNGTYSKDFVCFHDSTSSFPNQVKSIRHGKLLLEDYDDGYFWCIYRDPYVNDYTEESEKFLYIRNETSLLNVYAVKFRSNYRYNNTDLLRLWIHASWAKELIKYFRHVNAHVHVDVEMEIIQSKHDKLVNLLYDRPNYKRLRNMKLKRKYLDRKTLLYHVELHPDINNITVVPWDRLEVLQIKPVYYCKEFMTEYGEIVPQRPMHSKVELKCGFYTCDGDFNEGVSWVTTDKKLCNKMTKLQQLIYELQRMVKKTVHVNEVANILPKVNEILRDNQYVKSDGQLFYLLDQLGFAMILNESQTNDGVILVETDVALLVADANSSNKFWGFEMYTQNQSSFTKNSFAMLKKPLNKTTDNEKINSSMADVMVEFPKSIAMSETRFTFVVFGNSSVFSPKSVGRNFNIINSRVVSINVKNHTHFDNGEVVKIFFKPLRRDILKNESFACAYKHYTEDEDNSGRWLQDGCFFRPASPGMLDACLCNHLTHFALLIVPMTDFSHKIENDLEIISGIGCGISIFGLIVVAVTAAMFKIWRQNFTNKIWLHLCISILFMSICFLVILFVKFKHNDNWCMLVGIALHYSVLCSFCWMLVAAVLSYRRLVIVFNTDVSHKLLKATAFSYGAPCAVVGVLLSVDLHSYTANYKASLLCSFCYPSGLGLWLAVYAPIVTILVVNWTLYILIVCSVFGSKRIGVESHGDSKEAVRCASVSCLLAVLFGLPWAIGLFAHHSIAAAYLFNITVSCQGFILFILLVLAHTSTRNLWLDRINAMRIFRKLP